MEHLPLLLWATYIHNVQFEFNYSSLEKPHIQNDTVTLHKKAAKDHQVRTLMCGVWELLVGNQRVTDERTLKSHSKSTRSL